MQFNGALQEANMPQFLHNHQAENNDLTHLAAVSHDLKSPLNAIIGFTQLIKLELKRCNVPEQVMEHLDIIDNASTEMLALINNMLTSVRIESGLEAPAPTLLSRSDLHLRTIALEKTFACEAKSRGIDFSVHVHSLPDFVYWDILKLRYFAVNNIVSNALKFVGDGGTVKVDIQQLDANTVQMAISDNGPGIPLAERPEVFKKFKQATNTERHFSGSGFGLFNAAHIVKAHNGTIEIEDGLDGRGVTFLIRVPVMPFSIKDPDLKAFAELTMNMVN